MNKTKISAEIIADSIDERGNRLTSLLITFPRFILAEVNTHRMLSKNTSSSRAIPFNKMVEAVENNPFIPIAWQKEHKGMQGSEYLTKDNFEEFVNLENNWIVSREQAVTSASVLNKMGVTKQLCNRLLEPFMWTTMLITGSREGWDNFFSLRNPVYELKAGTTISNSKDLYFKSYKDLLQYIRNNSNNQSLIQEFENKSILEKLQLNKGQAEIHIMDLAEKIYDAVNESTPKQLKAGEWHIPFEDKINIETIKNLTSKPPMGHPEEDSSYLEAIWYGDIIDNIIKISTAMAARTSYTVVGDEKEIDYSKMIELHDRLLSQNPPHSSPLEHACQVMTDEEYNSFIKGKLKYLEPEDNWDIEEPLHSEKGWCGPYKGFISYRYFIDNKLKI
jgi:hypothetical protein